MVTHLRLICLLIMLLPTYSFAQQQLEAEVITWWVSGGERAAIQTLIDHFEAQGHKWIDTPVESSYHAKTAAVSRILDGKPPAAVQWQAGVALKQVFKEGLFRNINEVAKAENWRAALPEAIWENITVDGNIIAVPMTLHGSNWIWANKIILDEVGVTVPQSWSEFMEVAAKIRSAGYIPLALGGQPWQERALFLPIVIGTGGKDFYEDALVEHKQSALLSQKMVNSFRTFGELRQFIDPASKGRKWSVTARLVIEGKAAFQVMGDWVKGEFFQAGLVPGKDFICSPSPGSKDFYMMVSDTFAMGNGTDLHFQKGQEALAKTAMNPEVQRQFNMLKGAIPPRSDVSPEGFDMCAKLAMATVAKKGAATPGFNMANTGVVASSIMHVISSFWNDPSISPEKAANMLAEAVAKAKM